MPPEKSSILKPGMGVDLVLNLASMTPVIRNSIILDLMGNRMIIAQPRIRIKEDDKFATMHISSLVRETGRGKVRKGRPCSIIRFIKSFKLANGSIVQAIEIECPPGPAKEINIRNAFRFSPDSTYSVMGKLVFRGKEYYSGTHFKIFDISIKGLGILIPKKIKDTKNPLIEINLNEQAKIGLLLKSTENNEIIHTIESEFIIVRTKHDYNDKNGYAGAFFKKLHKDAEDLLTKFIHQGQLYEIRVLNRL